MSDARTIFIATESSIREVATRLSAASLFDGPLKIELEYVGPGSTVEPGDIAVGRLHDSEVVLHRRDSVYLGTYGEYPLRLDWKTYRPEGVGDDSYGEWWDERARELCRRIGETLNVPCVAIGNGVEELSRYP